MMENLMDALRGCICIGKAFTFFERHMVEQCSFQKGC